MELLEFLSKYFQISMSNDKDETTKHIIEIPEITRVEGHSAIQVEIRNGEVQNVMLDVFEGTRFFEKIVVGHKYDEIPHITSRVCAICSTGHVLASSFAIEKIFGITCDEITNTFRKIMHLGMFIESHSTHIYALALPDFLGARDLLDFGSKFKTEFADWTLLRNLGTAIQSIIGGRPFHPVNLHVGGLSHIPAKDKLEALLTELKIAKPVALKTCELLLKFNPPVERTTKPLFMALIPEDGAYGFFGNKIRSSNAFESDIKNYKEYLAEQAVNYSHAKRSTGQGPALFVGAMARLNLFGDLLKGDASAIYTSSPMAQGDNNSIWNNLAQSIEVVHAIDESIVLIEKILAQYATAKSLDASNVKLKAGVATGAVECPRGTLYHHYELDSTGTILVADMVTPSAQNSWRIEMDIKETVMQSHDIYSEQLQNNLETLVRAYDPCNTCATHMVSISYLEA